MGEGGPSAKDRGLTEKDTQVGEFDPKKYKSYADLPEDMKPYFEELDGGAFVKKSTAISREKFEKESGITADKYNKKLAKGRSLLDKIRRIEPKGKIDTMDVVQERAKNVNEHFVEGEFSYKFIRGGYDIFRESFKGMTKDKLDAEMEEVYQEVCCNNPEVEREELFNKLKKDILFVANELFNRRDDDRGGSGSWYGGMEEEVTKVANTMRLAVGESEIFDKWNKR